MIFVLRLGQIFIQYSDSTRIIGKQCNVFNLCSYTDTPKWLFGKAAHFDRHGNLFHFPGLQHLI